MLIRTALAAAVSLAALNAQASELSRVAAAFGNTVMSIYPDGRTQKIWLHPDGVWEGVGRNGQALAGKWTMKNEKVCLRQTKPPTLPFSYCTGFPDDPHIGVTWTSKDFSGTPIRLTVLKGMPQPQSPAPTTAR
ncbi:hypothetical protein [Phenylobacterium soli]|uniref:DUF995 domain-containing protein n=1 Tax=Phenylobacterium soli TaxID=2170551 RepID=A0A328AF18_9CAUL|nr:hypothetical protein [Phenylobacterium soli]RAK53310.1 hypothetical protein DJ017_01585 [Phenylobacterium soli]